MDFCHLRDFEEFGKFNDNHLKESSELTDTNNMFPGELIRIDQDPNRIKYWKYPPLFSENIQGSYDVWQVGQAGDITKIVSIIDNVLKTEITDQNPRKEYIKKLKEGYKPGGNELPSSLNGCMLAKTYTNSESNLGPNEARINKFPVSVMRKIDGIRSLTKIRAGKVEMVSRQGNLFSHFEHIKKEILEFMMYLPPYCQLDGELYSLDLSFSELTSVVKTIKNKHRKCDKVEYWIFDIIDPLNMVWEERYEMLVNAYSRYLEDHNSSNTFRIMQSYTVSDHDEIIKYHDMFIKEGYEGIIIRRYSSIDPVLSKYKPGRNNNLLKYKSFKDEEVTIVSVKEGITVRRGILEFKVKMRSNQEITEKDIGKKLTIRYGSDGIVGIALRDYE